MISHVNFFLLPVNALLCCSQADWPIGKYIIYDGASPFPISKRSTYSQDKDTQLSFESRASTMGRPKVQKIHECQIKVLIVGSQLPSYDINFLGGGLGGLAAAIKI